MWLLRWIGLDVAKQATLFRLRARLKLRQFTGETGKIVGLLVSLFTIGPLVVAAAVGTTYGYWYLEPPWRVELLGGVLVLLWLVWLLMPIVAFSANEALDISRLLIYPLRPRDLLAATFWGTLFDFPTYLLVPLFVAIALGWGIGFALPVVVVGLLLCYAHMVIGSQLVLLTASGLLRSRRFRDLSIVLVSFFGFSCYFVNQLFRWLFSRLDLEQLATLRPLLVLQWLPPGATARAIERATAGAWSAAVAWLLYSLLLLIIVAWAWQRLMLALITGHHFLSAPVQEKKGYQGDQGEKTSKRGIEIIPRLGSMHLFSKLPFDIRYLFVNELRSIWRMPQRRISLVQALMMPIFFAAIAIFNPGSGQTRSMLSGNVTMTPWLTLILPGYSMLSVWIMSINMLGWESRGLSSLLVTPVERWRIFVGKGLGLLLVTTIPLALMGAVAAILFKSWLMASSILGAVGISAIVIGVSAVASVLFAYPVNPDSISRQTGFSSGGCITALANTFLVPMMIMIACLPIIGLLVGAAWWGHTWLLAFFMLCAVAYGAVIFWFGSRFAGKMLRQREPEVLLATRLADD